MKTKPPQKNKITKLCLIIQFLEKEDHCFTISELRPFAEKELDIKTKKPLYDHLNDLKNIGILEPAAIGYKLPDNWFRSSEYLINLCEYFRVYEFKPQPKNYFFALLYRKVEKFYADRWYNWYKEKEYTHFQKTLNRFKPNSAKRREQEVYWHLIGLENSLIMSIKWREVRFQVLSLLTALKKIKSEKERDELLIKNILFYREPAGPYQFMDKDIEKGLSEIEKRCPLLPKKSYCRPLCE